MIIDTKGRLLKARNVWFEQVSSLDDIPKDGADIVYIYGNSQPLSGGKIICHKQYSAITDLIETEEELFAALGSTLRYKIKRAEREGTEVSYFTGEEAVCRLPAFAETFENMYEQKGNREELPIEEMKTYALEGKLLVSIASIGGKAAVYHSYVCDDKHCRLTFTCSEFRAVSTKEEKQAFARANELLHWKDITYFKEKGLFSYDWGGLTSPEDPNGIDRFKLGFGCKIIEYYNIVKLITMKAMLVGEIKSLIAKRS